MPVHQVIYVVAVGNRFMSTVRTVNMVGVVTTAPVLRRTSVRVGIRDRNGVLINMTIVRVVQVPVMKVVDMTIVDNGLMAAVRTVNVRVCFVDLAISHG